jgi:hypothetical protein
LGGVAISWELRKQKTVALSSTKAEYMAMGEVAKEAIHVKGLFIEICGVSDPIAVTMIIRVHKNYCTIQCFTGILNIIDLRHHFIREAAGQRHIHVKYVTRW